MHYASLLRSFCLTGIAGFFLLSGGFAEISAASGQTGDDLARLHALEHQHFQAEWKYDPVSATLEGIHEGDKLFPDLSETNHARNWARLANEEAELKRLDLSDAPLREQNDRDILLATITGEKLYEEVIRPDIHQPDYAISLVTNGIYGLIARDFAPLQNRMSRVIARMVQIPAILNICAQHLNKVPTVYNEIALEDLAGALAFFRNDLPAAFTPISSPSLRQKFSEINQAVIAALQDYGKKLRQLKTSDHFALGRPAMVQLLAEDMIDTPPETIIALGKKRLADDRADFMEVAKQISPDHPEKALEIIRKNHPAEDGLLATVQQQLWDARNFVVARHLVALPSLALPKVRLTPGFEQALFTAATDWPGPFERLHLPSFYNITPPAPYFTSQQKEEALEDFNRPALLNITVHEAMPGHFVQGLYLRSHPQWSLVRRNGGSYTTTEGWAHYAEQMMVEQGFDNHSPALHLMQLQDALLRDCRLIVAFGLHMQNMTLQQATDIMQQQCFQSPVSAYKEARRGTVDPGYFSYALGKMMILKLRDDQQKALGTHFSLLDFHNAILNAGLVPLAVIRKEMPRPTADDQRPAATSDKETVL